MSKKVIMACSNYWTSPLQVGSHQIAKVFVKKGWEVAFDRPHFGVASAQRDQPGLEGSVMNFIARAAGGFATGGCGPTSPERW